MFHIVHDQAHKEACSQHASDVIIITHDLHVYSVWSSSWKSMLSLCKWHTTEIMQTKSII